MSPQNGAGNLFIRNTLIGAVVLAAVAFVVPALLSDSAAPPESGDAAAGPWYRALVADCRRQTSWTSSCALPAIPDIDPFLEGRPCACRGRILRHVETGLYRCEELPAACGGASFERTLGRAPEMDRYEDVTPM